MSGWALPATRGVGTPGSLEHREFDSDHSFRGQWWGSRETRLSLPCRREEAEAQEGRQGPGVGWRSLGPDLTGV